MIISNIFPGKGNNEMGRISEAVFGFEIFGRGITNALFHFMGKVQSVSDPLCEYYFLKIFPFFNCTSIFTILYISLEEQGHGSDVILLGEKKKKKIKS